MNGNWKLIGPDGQEFVGMTPLKCCQKEIDSRVPKEVQTKRLMDMMSKCSLCEEGRPKHTLGRDTPAEIAGICETCFQTILSDCVEISDSKEKYKIGQKCTNPECEDPCCRGECRDY